MLEQTHLSLLAAAFCLTSIILSLSFTKTTRLWDFFLTLFPWSLPLESMYWNSDNVCQMENYNYKSTIKLNHVTVVKEFDKNKLNWFHSAQRAGNYWYLICMFPDILYDTLWPVGYKVFQNRQSLKYNKKMLSFLIDVTIWRKIYK